MPQHEWTKGELIQLRPGTYALAQVHRDHDREFVVKRPDHPEMWVSWQGQHIASGALLEQGEFTVLWSPDDFALDPEMGSDEDDVVRVPVIGTANLNDRPRDYEPENWATDGSADMERESLTQTSAYWRERARKAEVVIEGAKALVETMSSYPVVSDASRSATTVGFGREFRELRMVLSGGMAVSRTTRADELVEKWMQDPQRNVFGLAADLLDVIGPEKH